MIENTRRTGKKDDHSPAGASTRVRATPGQTRVADP